MLERDLRILQQAAQKQGLMQSMSVNTLRIMFETAKMLVGLKDIPIGETPEIRNTRKTPQMEKMLTLGFHVELGMNEDDYIAGMPTPPAQPERFRGRFDIPILIDPRVSLLRQIAIHGVRTDLTEAQLTQLALSMQKNDENTQNPYYMWVEEKIAYKNIGTLAWNERPINILEALALLREHPKDIFRKLGTFSFSLGNMLSEDTVASIAAAGSTVPGPLSYTKLDENVRILTSGTLYGTDHPSFTNAFILKGRAQ